MAEWLEVDGEETLSVFHFPQTHWRRLRTTNGIERVNQEIKRRTRVVRIFPDRRSCLRLATALLKEYHEDWITGRRYLRMGPLYELEAARARSGGGCERPAAGCVSSELPVILQPVVGGRGLPRLRRSGPRALPAVGGRINTNYNC